MDMSLMYRKLLFNGFAPEEIKSHDTFEIHSDTVIVEYN